MIPIVAQWIRSWKKPIVSLDAVGKRGILYLGRESNPEYSILQIVA
jgi:hypothetical protein